jgi:hypothetical protein
MLTALFKLQLDGTNLSCGFAANDCLIELVDRIGHMPELNGFFEKRTKHITVSFVTYCQALESLVISLSATRRLFSAKLHRTCSGFRYLRARLTL